MGEPEFTTYPVTAFCRDCGETFETLAFFPTLAKRYGLCDECRVRDQARAEARQNRPDLLKKKRETADLTPPRRIWEPD